MISGAQGLTLGMFLANMGIIATIGESNHSIFQAILDMQTCIDSLRHITIVLNQPTDLVERMLTTNKQRKTSLEMQREYRERFPGQDHLTDRMPILLQDIQFTYTGSNHCLGQHSKVNLRGHIEMQQGTLSAFVGPHSEGKTTLLRILGSVMFPDKGLCFVPSHLRVLHVTAETYFYRGTLLDNLTFGVDASNPDSSSAHVRLVLERLGVTQRVLYYFEGGHLMPWSEVLSQTECQFLNLARAFVFNPEVLCIDKPLSVFDEAQGQNIMRLLRDFVRSKGVEQNPETAGLRRPRTCAIATDRTTGLEEVDQIFRVSHDEGIQPFTDRLQMLVVS